MVVTDVTGDVGSGLVCGLWVVVPGGDVTSDVGLLVGDVCGDVSDWLSDVTG